LSSMSKRVKAATKFGAGPYVRLRCLTPSCGGLSPYRKEKIESKKFGTVKRKAAERSRRRIMDGCDNAGDGVRMGGR